MVYHDAAVVHVIDSLACLASGMTDVGHRESVTWHVGLGIAVGTLCIVSIKFETEVAVSHNYSALIPNTENTCAQCVFAVHHRLTLQSAVALKAEPLVSLDEYPAEGAWR